MRGSAIAFLLLLLAAPAHGQVYIGLSSGLRLDCSYKYPYYHTYLAIDLGSRVSKKSFIDVELGYNSLSYIDIEKNGAYIIYLATITKILTNEIFFNINLKNRVYMLRFQSDLCDSVPICTVIGINNNLALNQSVYRLNNGSPELSENVQNLFYRGSSLNCGFSIEFETSKFKYSLIPTIVYPMYVNHDVIKLPFHYTINLKLLASLKCNR